MSEPLSPRPCFLKVYKFFLSRALEASEDRAPVQLLKQALNTSLGEFRPVDDDLLLAAMSSEDATAFKVANRGRTKKAKKPKRGNGCGGKVDGEESTEGASTYVSHGGAGRKGKAKLQGKGGGEGVPSNRMAALRELEVKLAKGNPIDGGDDGFGKDGDGAFELGAEWP